MDILDIQPMNPYEEMARYIACKSKPEIMDVQILPMVSIHINLIQFYYSSNALQGILVTNLRKYAGTMYIPSSLPHPPLSKCAYLVPSSLCLSLCDRDRRRFVHLKVLSTHSSSLASAVKSCLTSCERKVKQKILYFILPLRLLLS